MNADAEGRSRKGRQAASPRARRAMRARGLDPDAVCRWLSQCHAGSGPGGRIVEADILRHESALKCATGSAGGSAAATLVPISPMRMAIAKRTAESFATIPHFYLRAEADVTEMVGLRAEMLAGVQKEHGVRLTVTDFILTAAACALAHCRWANRIWHQDGLLEFSCVDLAMQVAVPDGLLAPVVRRADTLGLVEMATQRSRLVAAARSGRLPADALGGAATSVSNLGQGRVDEFAAVIMPPQSSTLAAGRAAARPLVVGGELAVRTTLRLCLSVDHRVMDGVAAAEFLGKIIELLEHPARLPRTGPRQD